MKHLLIAERIIGQPWGLLPATMDAICGAVFNESPQAGVYDDPRRGGDDDEPMGGENGVAVIPVKGILGKHLSSLEMTCGGCSVDKVSAALHLAMVNENVRSVMLAFHSPGGVIQGIPELHSLIRAVDARKPVIGFTDGDCASAALWLASACRKFYATPSARVGSVGVYTVIRDDTEKNAKEGVKFEPFVSGKYKLTGAPFRSLTEDERKMLDARVQELGKQFRATLTERRSIADDDMQGQLFSGVEAVAKGFADGMVDDFDEAMGMAELAQGGSEVDFE